MPRRNEGSKGRHFIMAKVARVITKCFSTFGKFFISSSQRNCYRKEEEGTKREEGTRRGSTHQDAVRDKDK